MCKWNDSSTIKITEDIVCEIIIYKTVIYFNEYYPPLKVYKIRSYWYYIYYFLAGLKIKNITMNKLQYIYDNTISIALDNLRDLEVIPYINKQLDEYSDIFPDIVNKIHKIIFEDTIFIDF